MNRKRSYLYIIPWWLTQSRSSKGWTSTMYNLTRLVSRRNLNHWYPFVSIYIWKSRHDLRPCSSRLRAHLSQLGSLGDTQVHLMQSDRSPPTPRPLGANPRNARPHNITLAITKNCTRFNGLSLSCSRIIFRKRCLIYLLSLLPTADVQTESQFNVSIAVVQILLSKSRKIPFPPWTKLSFGVLS
jgi:hypothetical protein